MKRAVVACLLSALQAFANALRHWAEEDTIAPPLLLPPTELGGPFLEFSSWSEVSEMCGDSRVWAGLHFEVGASVCECVGIKMANFSHPIFLPFPLLRFFCG